MVTFISSALVVSNELIKQGKKFFNFIYKIFKSDPFHFYILKVTDVGIKDFDLYISDTDKNNLKKLVPNYDPDDKSYNAILMLISGISKLKLKNTFVSIVNNETIQIYTKDTNNISVLISFLQRQKVKIAVRRHLELTAKDIEKMGPAQLSY
jgi:hypothetical protein